MRALGRQFDLWRGPVLPPRRTTRKQTMAYQNIGRDYSDPAELRRSFAYDLNLPIPDDTRADIYLKRGYLVYESEAGRRLTWDWVTYLGQEVLKDYSYFYIISSDAGAIDDVDHEGKTKLGYSAAKSSKAGFAMRLSHYQQWWGPSAKLHMLIVFNNVRKQALQFEIAVKKKVKPLLELGPNVRFHEILQYNRQHEFFRLRELGTIMREAKEVYNSRKMSQYWTDS